MSEQRTSVEIIAPTVEEAVERGAAELGLPRESLEVEVIDEGGKGLFGLGNRQARVRLRLRSGEAVPASPEAVSRPAPAPRERSVPAAPAEPEPMSEDEEEALRVAKEIVIELLERLGVEARVVSSWGQADGEEADPAAARESRPLLVDVRGSDLSLLIGRKGETLSALQYITRLIVAKELGHPAPVVIDVEGYRERRERQLRQLARRMAGQAVEFGRTMTLEPMPPAERRIIHIELRDRQDVRTESVGEGEHRKVTIIPLTAAE
jgi:spoIIIJ-associated protein